MKIARFPAYRDLSGFDFTQSVANDEVGWKKWSPTDRVI
jgi:hypothetical protein